MDQNLALHDVRNHLYDQAEKWWWWSLGLTGAMQIILLTAVIWNQETAVYISGFIALVVPLAATWLRVLAGGYSGKGDKVRRLILYAEGLGRDIPPQEMSTIRSWTIGESMKPAPFEGPYFASNLEPGPKKLADITAESAFFTKNLAAKAYRFLVGAFVVSLLILAAIIYVGLIVEKGTGNAPVLGNVILLFASVLLGGDVLLLMKRYNGLKAAAGAAFDRCADLRDREAPTTFEVMQAVEDYHLALVPSPPIPFKLYKRYGGHLNEVYRSSHSTPSRTE